MTPVWWSQPFPPEGSTASDGILRQLGAPALDPLVVLLRETAQNSWDARLSETSTVTLRYSVDRLAERATEFAGLLLPGPVGDLHDIEGSLSSESVLLSVSDRGTTGLGGPLRSNVPPGADPPNFVNFIRNVGEARDREGGGGTYGFGKGALYRLSGPGVVIVDTTCSVGERLQRRLMGAALGHTFVRDELRYTGRHWWGTTNDGIIDPLLDDDARDIAMRLGLRGFEPGDTGTDIYVVGVDLGESEQDEPRDIEAAASMIASAGLWYLWPKLLTDRPNQGRFELEVFADGQVVEVPDPEQTPRLRCFTDALRRLDDGDGTQFTRQRRPRSIGTFAAVKDVLIERSNPVVDTAAPFPGRAHHCAQMRHVELVVDYLAGDMPDDAALEYGAVFRASADTEVEACFAAAEPPTHDAWIVQHLSGTQRGVVKGARRFVRDQMSMFARPRGADSGEGGGIPLGGLSRALAAMLPAAGDGGGGGADPLPRRVGRRRDTSAISAIGRPYLVIRDGEPVVAQRVRFGTTGSAIEATAVAEVAVDGGTEKVVPPGAPTPEVIGWQESGGVWIESQRVAVAVTAGREWTVLVRPAPDTATAVRVVESRS